MCTQPEQSTAPQANIDEQLPLELRKASMEVQLATLRANAEYNASPAGQMQRQFETYQRIAKPLSESAFVPAAYKGNIGDCIIAVEMAARLGVFPLTVMQNLCIVKGNPTWKSRFLIGCVNTCGRYSTLDYRMTVDGTVGSVQYKTWEKDATGKNREILKTFPQPQLPNLVCVAFATERATGKVLTSTPVSVRMAVQEGWYSKDGSKWPSMPEQMLRYRAASFWVSTFAPEMSMGFRTEEEQRDIVDVDFEEVRQSGQSKPTPASIDEAKEKLRNRAAKQPKSATSTEMP
ncbi:MAG: hypothetical protein HDS72_04545 [Bacteroidales bacterium]|nr:hypothetical protein [Bacteroidales bacterium]